MKKRSLSILLALLLIVSVLPVTAIVLLLGCTAAPIGAPALVSFCVGALLLTFGKSSELGVLVMGILLFIDYRQWLGTNNKTALKLTVKTGLISVLIGFLFYLLLSIVLIAVALIRA